MVDLIVLTLLMLAMDQVAKADKPPLDWCNDTVTEGQKLKKGIRGNPWRYKDDACYFLLSWLGIPDALEVKDGNQIILKDIRKAREHCKNFSIEGANVSLPSIHSQDEMEAFHKGLKNQLDTADKEKITQICFLLGMKKVRGKDKVEKWDDGSEIEPGFVPKTWINANESETADTAIKLDAITGELVYRSTPLYDKKDKDNTCYRIQVACRQRYKFSHKTTTAKPNPIKNGNNTGAPTNGSGSGKDATTTGMINKTTFQTGLSCISMLVFGSLVITQVITN